MINYIERLWNASIRRQLMLGIIAVHAILMTIFVYDLVHRQKTFLHEQAIEQVLSLAESLAANSTSWVLANDVIGLEEVVLSQSKYPGFQFAMIISPLGRILSHNQHDLTGKYIQDATSKSLLKSEPIVQTLIATDRLIDVAAPVLANGHHIAWARVRVSQDTIEKNLDVVTRDGALYTVAAIIIGIIFAIIMARGLTHSLQHMVSVAEELREGKKGRRIELKRIDELGTLGTVFNALADAVDKRETELKHQHEHLEELVIERTQKLQSTLETLQQTQTELIEVEKMASLGGLVAGIAHEINTPIGIGVTAVTHLKEKADDIEKIFNDGTLRKNDFASFIKTATQSSDMVLTNLMRASDLVKSFKQVAVDQTSEAPRPFNLIEYLEEVLISLQPQLKRTKHEIHIEGERNLVVETVPGPVSQIITNLIMNSLLHAYDDQEAGQIHINVSHDENNAHLSYKDDGKGMAPETVAKVFEPFFTTKRGSGGSGLGMHILYNQVTQNLCGSVECISTLGEGTTFNIIFPLKKGA